MLRLACKKSKYTEERSHKITKAHVEQSMEENIKANIEMQDPVNKGIGNIDQLVHATKEENMSIGELEIVSKPTKQPMDLIETRFQKIN